MTETKLNNLFRSKAPLGNPEVPGQYVVTPGIAALPAYKKRQMWAKVRSQKNSAIHNNDFGTIQLDNTPLIFWKIDVIKHERILTIMLASEY